MSMNDKGVSYSPRQHSRHPQYFRNSWIEEDRLTHDVPTSPLPYMQDVVSMTPSSRNSAHDQFLEESMRIEDEMVANMRASMHDARVRATNRLGQIRPY